MSIVHTITCASGYTFGRIVLDSEVRPCHKANVSRTFLDSSNHVFQTLQNRKE